MLIVVVTTDHQTPDFRHIYTDHFQVVETMEEAQKIYDEAIQDQATYCAAICEPIIGTEPDWVPDAPRPMVTGDIMHWSDAAALWGVEVAFEAKNKRWQAGEE